MINYFDLNGAKTFLNKIRDEFNTEGFKIDDGNLSYTEKNEIIISGLKESATVDGVEISNGKIILSESVLDGRDIKLEKATGIFKDNTLELAESVPKYFLQDSILTAENGVLNYQSAHYNTYNLNDSGAKIICSNVGKANVTVSGLQETLAVENGAVTGADISGNSLVISSEVVLATPITISGDNASLTIGNAAKVSLQDSFLNFNESVTISGGKNSTYKGAGDSAITFQSHGNTYIYSGGNDTINELEFDDKFIVNGKEYPVAIPSVRPSASTQEITIGEKIATFNWQQRAGYFKTHYKFMRSPEIYYGTADTESIRVFKENGYYFAEDMATGERIKPLTTGAPMSGINAGAGNDTIFVDSGVEGLSICGGAGNDYITISPDAGANIYVFNYGNGKDTIDGWRSDKDTLLFTHDYSASMSEDGKELIIKSGSHSVTFINMQYGKTVKVLKTENGTADTVTFSKIMQGTARNNEMHNDGVEGYYDNGAVLHDGTADSYWVMDAASGNDDIYNSGNYVSISGGAGKDEIWVKKKSNGTLTEGVTINGGAGNDYIDVRGDVADNASFADYKNDAATNTKITGHVYEFGTADGTDSIYGYNAKDTIVLTGLDGVDVAESISSSVDLYGNFILTAGATTIKIIKPENDATALLGGMKLNIKVKTSDGALKELFDNSIINGATTYANIATKVIDTPADLTTDPPTAEVAHYEIPKKVLLTNGSDEEVYDSTYNNYTIDAASGNDYITISGAAISVDGGFGNDHFTISGGTNVNFNATSTADTYTTIGGGYALKGNSALINSDAVTILGSYGDDEINAVNDKISVGGKIVRASHVYEVNTTDSGRDSIFGFNEYDTIKVSGYVTEAEAAAALAADSDSTVTATVIKTAFDATGKFLILFIGNSQVWLDVSNDYFKGGKTLNIVTDTGAPITGLETPLSAADVSIGYLPLEKVSLTSSGIETTNITLATSWKYTTPRRLVGTNWEDTLENVDDNFIVDGKNSNDEIWNSGANVSIIGGSGDDTIYLQGNKRGVTVNGGLGNDAIYNEYVTIAADSENTVYATEIGDGIFATGNSTVGHVYEFSAGSGNDTIYFFGENDTIKLDSVTSYIAEPYYINSSGSLSHGTEVIGNDLILKLTTQTVNATTGEVTTGTQITSTVTLKDFVKRNSENASDPYDKTFTLLTTTDGVNFSSQFITVPRVLYGTTGSDSVELLTNTKERFLISALAGNDEILNIGNQSTIEGAAGKDTITNIAENVSVNAGYGNDEIFIYNSNNNTINAGAGNDSIYGYNSGGNLYTFGESEGTNYIFGFNSGDTIYFAGVKDDNITVSGVESPRITREVTYEGVALTLKTNSGYDSTKVIIKGALQADENTTALINNVTAKKTALATAEQNVEIYFWDENYIAAYETAKAEFIAAIQAFNAYLAADVKHYINPVANSTIVIKADTDTEGVFSTSTYTVPKLIAGSNGSDRISDGTSIGAGQLIVTAGMDNYTIDAKAGHDEIFSNAQNISISGGIGDDTITLQNNALHNTINAGVGNDLIINNGGGHLFEYAVGDGYDSIQGFSASDSITITTADATYATAFSKGDLNINVKQNGYIVGTISINDLTEGVNTFHINNDVLTFTLPTIQILPSGVRVQRNETLQGFSAEDTLSIQDCTYSTQLKENGFNISLNGGEFGTILIAGLEEYNVRTININNDVISIPQVKNISSGGESFTNADSDCAIFGTADSTINNSASYVTLQSGVINNTGTNVSIVGAGNDTIANSANYVTIDAIGGADVVKNEGSFVSINGGAGIDCIYLGNGVDSLGNEVLVNPTAANCTIVGGASNDSIWSNDNGHVYKFTKGDGKDVIYNFSSNDTIEFYNNSSTAAMGVSKIFYNTTKQESVEGEVVDVIDYDFNNVIIGSGTSSITLESIAVGTSVKLFAQIENDSAALTDKSFTVPKYHVVTTSEFNNTVDSLWIQGSDNAETISNSADFVSIFGGAGNDSISNSGTNTTYIYNTSSGADTITGFNQSTDLICVETADTSVTFAVNPEGVLVSIGTNTTVLLENISGGNIRYKIADGEIQTYTIS